MSGTETKGKAEVTIKAVVTRADGTKEDLGVVSRKKVDKSLFTRILKPILKYGNRTN